VKTLGAHFVRCIFSHVRSISYDVVCSNRVLSILRGVHFELSHSLGRLESFLAALAQLPRLGIQRRTRIELSSTTPKTLSSDSGPRPQALGMMRPLNPSPNGSFLGAQRRTRIEGSSPTPRTL
jgi:hypothetical protein